MARITVSSLIPAPPAEVWTDVAHLETHREWMSDAEAIDFLDDRREGVGTRMRVATRIGPFRTSDLMEFTEWDPPRSMGVHHQGLFTGEGRFSLEPEGEGTRFTWSEQLAFPWYLGGPIGALVAAPILRLVWRRNLARLGERF